MACLASSKLLERRWLHSPTVLDGCSMQSTAMLAHDCTEQPSTTEGDELGTAADDASIAVLIASHCGLAPGERSDAAAAIVQGRLTARRKHGVTLVFLDLAWNGYKVQLVVDCDGSEGGYLAPLGSILRAGGTPGRTIRGELSLFCSPAAVELLQIAIVPATGPQQPPSAPAPRFHVTPNNVRCSTACHPTTCHPATCCCLPPHHLPPCRRASVPLSLWAYALGAGALGQSARLARPRRVQHAPVEGRQPAAGPNPHPHPQPSPNSNPNPNPKPHQAPRCQQRRPVPGGAGCSPPLTTPPSRSRASRSRCVRRDGACARASLTWSRHSAIRSQ